MEINLKQNEIEAALRQYVASQGFSLSGRDVSITFTSGRTANGLTALVDIGDAVEAKPVLGGSTLYRSAELRSSDHLANSGAVGTASVADTPLDPGAQNEFPGEGQVDAAEDPAEPAALASDVAEETPKSLFNKAQ